MKHLPKIFTTSILAIFTLIQVSCKKSDPEPAAIDVAATLQNKNWKITALTMAPALAGVTDIYNDSYDACERDNLYKFNTADVFLLDEGATLCNTGDPQTLTGTWNYNASTKIIHYQILGDSWDLLVTSINENVLIGTMQDIISGVTYTSTWTFTKQ